MAYRYEKKAKLLTFGEYPLVSLRAARQHRDEAKALLKSGIDPAEHKKRASALIDTTSFQAVATEWYEQHTLHHDKAHRSFLLNHISKRLRPSIGDIPMSDLTTEDIIAVMAPLQQTGVSHAAYKLADICSQICRYAVATGKAEHDVTEDMPASLRPKQGDYRAATLDVNKIGKILLNLEQHDGYFPIGCALRLIPLFFANVMNLRCAEWSEFDFSRRLWIIPAERMITKHEHIVPLAHQAVKILKELQEYTGRGKLLFPNPCCPENPTHRSTISALLNKYSGEGITFRAIRSFAARRLAELSFERKIITLQLAHPAHEKGRHQRNKTMFDHWQYIAERKVMMQEWANHLTLLRNKAFQESFI